MPPIALSQYRMIHDVYVLLDDGDQRLLRSFNLSTSQFAVLVLLDAEQGWRLTDLSDHLLIDKSTVTRIIDRLEHMQLVRRVADAADRRVQRVVLTQEGVLQRDATRAAHEGSLERRMSSLTLDEQSQLEHLLSKLRNGLQADLVRAAAPISPIASS